MAFSWGGESNDNFDLYVKLIGSEPPLRLTMDPRPDRSPAWSPDGRWIAFVGGDELLLISPLGGPERKLGKATQTPPATHVSWSADSEHLVFTEPGARGQPLGIVALSVETGQRRQLTRPAGAPT